MWLSADRSKKWFSELDRGFKVKNLLNFINWCNILLIYWHCVLLFLWKQCCDIIFINNGRHLNECNFLIIALHSLSTEILMLSNYDSYGYTATLPHKASAWHVLKSTAPLLNTRIPPRGCYAYGETPMKKSIHRMSSFHNMVVRLEVILWHVISARHLTTTFLNEKFPKMAHNQTKAIL